MNLSDPSGRGRRRARRWLLAVCLLCAGCNLIENEFTTLDRLPPSCRGPAPDAPPAAQARP